MKLKNKLSYALYLVLVVVFLTSCARCNRWKSTFSIEQFRNEIQQQLIRLKRDSSNYRMALDYNMIVEDNKPIVLFFESLQAKQNA